MAAQGYRLLIGGEQVDGDAGTYDIVNPATEAVVGQAPEASVAQVEAAAAAAADAFPAWSRTKPEERAALLNKAADLLRDRMDELIPLVQAETGATLRVAQTMQVPTCIERFRRYAKGALEPTTIPLPPGEMPSTALAAGGLMGAIAVRQPVGRRGLHHALQLPDREHGRQDRPGPGHGQHRGREARSAGSAGRHRVRRDPPRGRLPGRAWSTSSPGRRPRPARRWSRRRTSTW